MSPEQLCSTFIATALLPISQPFVPAVVLSLTLSPQVGE